MNQRSAKIQRSAMNKVDVVYQQMCFLSEKTGWPELYSGDLHNHDLKQLGEIDLDKPFVWTLRQLGTELTPIIYGTDVWHLDILNKVFGYSSPKWYAWDGHTFYEAPFLEVRMWAMHIVMKGEIDEELLHVIT